jgi:hypothetical protein
MRPTLLAAFLLVSFSPAALADAASARSDDLLRAEPSPAAATIGRVAANARLDVLERKGFWAKVQSANATGWLKLSSLNLETRPAEGASSLSTLSSLASGRTGSGNVVSAAGTRGLSAGELRAARPDYAALAEVKKLAAAPTQADVYAAAGGLTPRSVAYLPASKAGGP